VYDEDEDAVDGDGFVVAASTARMVGARVYACACVRFEV
jgi:hypothetical protein